jgi:cytochrome c-type biogenesis protein CcmH/NrfF
VTPAARSIAIALVIGTAVAFGPASAFGQAGATLADLEDEVMCPVCGTTLEQSNGPQAERERELIRRLVAEGRSKGEIEDALVAEYGHEVLAEPEAGGFDLAAWVVPILGLLGGGLLVGTVALRRSRRSASAAPEPPLGDADAARLREDMSRYER